MIADEEEVYRWFADGRAYLFMVDAYERQYGLSVMPSLFGEYRRRHGLTHAQPDQWLEDVGIETT